jgi:hypothetical protein
MLAILLCNFPTRALAFCQFLLNFFLPDMRRSRRASLGRNFFNGWHWRTTWPSDAVTKWTTPLAYDDSSRHLLTPYLGGAVTMTKPSACITASCKAGRISAIL